MRPGLLAERFETADPLTIGLEEEVFLLDPESLDLTPLAGDVLDRLDGDVRFQRELPAAQLELVTPPVRRVGDAISVLARGRARLVAERVVAMAAGVHPFAAVEGVVSPGARYELIAAEYGQVARSQLVAAFQVHVAVGDAARSLAVYNAFRSYLPEIAALSANAPFHGGVDTGFASIRPKLAEALPRQGVPPAISSWSSFEAELGWGARSGVLQEPTMWWWELRPHPRLGTLELRVADAQTTLGEAAAIAAFVHCVVAWLSARHDAGDRSPTIPTWRIEENRWSACRHGLNGTLADLETGVRTATRERLSRLLDQLWPIADRIGCAAELELTRALIAENGAMRQREVAAARGVHGLVAWLAERFCEPYPG